MSEDIDFGFYHPGDEEGILALYSKIFPKIQRDLSDWKWEYEANPFDSPIICLARFQDRIVAQEALFFVPVKTPGGSVIGAQSVDTMTEPAFRGRGIFKRLAMLSLEEGKRKGVPLYYGFPNKNSYKGYVSRFGWAEVGKVWRLIKVLDLPQALQARLASPRLCCLIGALASPFLRLYFWGREKAGPYVLKRVERFGPEMDEFWEKARDRFPFMIERTSAYLNWRYLDHPSAGYEAFYLTRKDDRQILGMTVVRTVDLQYRLASIGELFTLGWNPVLAAFLLGLILSYLKAKKVGIVASWLLPHSPFLPAYRDAGFRLRSKHQPLIAVSPDQSIPHNDLASLENWYITSGDYDMF